MAGKWNKDSNNFSILCNNYFVLIVYVTQNFYVLTPPFMAGREQKQRALALATMWVINGLKPRYFILFDIPPA